MLGFLYDLGCTFTLFVLVVFMEGVIATRKNAKWTGLILPAVLLSVGKKYNASEQQMLDALLVAAGFGAVITRNATVSGAEGGCGRGVGVEYGVALVGPLKAVAFLVALDYFVRKFLPEQVEVDGGDNFAVFVLRLCDAIGEQSADFPYVLVYQVLGMHSEVFHMCGVI